MMTNKNHKKMELRDVLQLVEKLDLNLNDIVIGGVQGDDAFSGKSRTYTNSLIDELITAVR